MPEISRFYGILIKMYFNDHQPPHFRAEYGNYELLISIDALAVIAGKFPPRAMGMVIEWASLHQRDRKRAWNQARSFEIVEKIEPLR